MTVRPVFEPLEDRIVLDGDPTVMITGPAQVDIGQQDVPLTLTFSNPDAEGDPGFAPYVDLILPDTGIDGDDGITFDSATFLGTTLTPTIVVFDAAGEAEHPLAVDTNGDPIIVSGNPGDSLVVFDLPYGSFTAGQPAVDIEVLVDISPDADLNAGLAISANGGFALGCDELDNPSTDPSTLGASETLTLTPQLFTVSKINDIPEEEAATGPNFIYRHTLTVDVADGQTLDDFTLTDTLPTNYVYVGSPVINGGTGATIVSEPPIGPVVAGDDTLEVFFDSITGTATVTFAFWIADVGSGGGPNVIDPATGDDVPESNTVNGTGSWTPTDADDATLAVSDSATDTFNVVSLAIQKSQAIIDDQNVAGLSPDDTVEFTLEIQVSDYFTYDGLGLLDRQGHHVERVRGA
ncbi:MAG: LEPR-XLL domain-containing protein, partial [Pseudomonadota bacterium]